jgi:hypothetical protein
MSETKFTPGPWEYIPSNKHHGPYVCGPFGGDICDCYIRNGGTSRPIHFQSDCADANAQLLAAAPELYATLAEIRQWMDAEMGAWDAKFIAQIDALLARARGEQP